MCLTKYEMPLGKAPCFHHNVEENLLLAKVKHRFHQGFEERIGPKTGNNHHQMN